MAATYTLEQSGNGRLMFTLRTHDGRVLLISQDFPDKNTALSRINATRHLVGMKKHFELRTAENGQPYFVLKNRHKEVIGQSEVYSDEESLSKGINLIKSNAKAAKLVDLTGRA